MEPSAFRHRAQIPAATAISLALGHAFDLLQQILDRSVHCVVTDPPYGNNKYDEGQVRRYHGGG